MAIDSTPKPHQSRARRDGASLKDFSTGNIASDFHHVGLVGELGLAKSDGVSSVVVNDDSSRDESRAGYKGHLVIRGKCKVSQIATALGSLSDVMCQIHVDLGVSPLVCDFQFGIASNAPGFVLQTSQQWP